MRATAFQAGDPYCSRCGFIMKGHEAAASCPECGAPMPAALAKYQPDAEPKGRARRWRSEATLWGWPLVDIALGADPKAGERAGRARGIIAIGDFATGGVAIGGLTLGVVSIGGVSAGVVSLGGVSLALGAGLGGVCLGGFAVGGVGMGGISAASVSLGYVAQGGVAAGVYARGRQAGGAHVVTPTQADAKAQQVFATLEPVLGPAPWTAPGAMLIPSLVPAVAGGLLAVLVGAVVLTAQHRHERRAALAAAGAPRRTGEELHP